MVIPLFITYFLKKLLHKIFILKIDHKWLNFQILMIKYLPIFMSFAHKNLWFIEEKN